MKQSARHIKEILAEAEETVKKVTEEHKTIADTKLIEGSKSLAEWFAFFDVFLEIKAYESALSDNPSLKKTGCLFLFLGLTLLFLAIITLILLLNLLFIPAGITTTIIFVIYFFWKNASKSNYDIKTRQSFISNYFLPASFQDFVLPVLTLLKDDIAPDSPVFLKMNLDGYANRKQDSQKTRPDNTVNRYKLKYYCHQNFVLSCRLTNDMRLFMEIKDRVTEKITPAYKTKYKQKTYYSVSISYAKGLFTIPGDVSSITTKMINKDKKEGVVVKTVFTDRNYAFKPNFQQFPPLMAKAFSYIKPVKA